VSECAWSGRIGSGRVGSGRVGSAGDTLRPERRRGRIPTRSARKGNECPPPRSFPFGNIHWLPTTLTRKNTFVFSFIIHHRRGGKTNINTSTDDTHKRRAREPPRRMRIRVLGSRDGPRVQEAIGCGVGREGRLFTHREAIEGSGRGAALLRAGGGGQQGEREGIARSAGVKGGKGRDGQWGRTMMRSRRRGGKCRSEGAPRLVRPDPPAILTVSSETRSSYDMADRGTSRW
jgi:hypothetical protein